MSATPPPPALRYTTPDRLLRDFASRGVVVLAPEALGIPTAIHEVIYRKESLAFVDNRNTISATYIPEILDVINAPGVVEACDRLVGKHWAIVPFTHNAPFASGGHDQHWHKDDIGPFNGRRQRRHHPVQIEMLYYPQAVEEDMGPTAIVPYSQYWAFNHEENHDNFAGADHLDFGYHLGGMEKRAASGPKSEYRAEDIAKRRTPHDVRMRGAIANTGWPLVRQFEVAPLKAGSVVLYSHNLFHRGNHRRDDWRKWRERPRFMWRFWLYRTHEPQGAGVEELDWRSPSVDPLTGQDLAQAPDDATVVWRHHHHWLRTGKPPAPRARKLNGSGSASRQRAKGLYQQLLTPSEAGEPARIGAAYKLADGETTLALEYLQRALRNEREAVRRAATYGLIAVGPAATDVFMAATTSPVKWLRKAGVFGLGEVGTPTRPVLRAIAARLREDPSVYVRSVAADALGCMGRRAVADDVGESLVPSCLDALVDCLRRERNRLAMNIAQGRHIKIVRPTDECDVCEGIGIDYGVDRFKPVRSAVRENALWATVILCSHGATIVGSMLQSLVDALAAVVRKDSNIFSVGSALDALNRLARLCPGDRSSAAEAQLDTLLEEMPILSWESLRRGGLAFDRSTQDST